jgi:hypothetical protein
MPATGAAATRGDFKQYTTGQSDSTTWAASGSGFADWVQVIGAGTVVVTTENDNNRTITTDAAEPAACIMGPFKALVSTTATRVRMGIGTPPPIAIPPTSVLDYVTGTALTDTATTTVQRVGPRTSFLLAGTMSQGETVTLGTTGAVDGDYIKIIRTSTSAQTCAVVNGGPGAGTLHTQVASKVNFTEARFNGTNWLLSACGPS